MTVDHVSKEFALQTMKADLSPGNKLSQHFCSIQVTSENGALCIINPLFIHEHGDRWLTNISQSQTKEKRRSVPWCCQQSVKIKTMRTPLVKEDTPDKISDEAEDKEENNQDETEWHLDIFKKLGMDDAYREFPQQQEEESKNVHNVNEPSDTHQEDTNIVRTFAVTPGSESKDQTKVECTGFRKDTTKLEEAHKVDNKTEEKKLHFPHRVSWIEAEHVAEVSLKKSNSETSLISSDSFLLPPLSELDSASISSVEDEKDCHSSPRRRKHPHGLGDIVRHSFLAVSTVLTGFVSPEKHLGNRIQQIAEDPSSYLGCKVQTFIGQFKEFSQHQSSTEMLQEIRQELTDLKNNLLESNDIWEIVEHHGIEDSKIASIIETSLHKCLLKPLRGKIYSQLIDIYNRDGSLTRLLSNQKRE
ncbi:uncharacterized protein LOC128653307 [Bombina bombina]|uniref:uncharacterized protein LOC128653307 n=1 Tax=Bombina bombina TaxID=8345 RepID=UPI00235AD89F|nr:uncharacterized protein LOC128653307 [Bombina bombina]